MLPSRMRSPCKAIALLIAALTWPTFDSPIAGASGNETDSRSHVTLDALLARFRAMPGLFARYREEKKIALLAEPLVGEGTVHYAPPSRMARHARTPARSSIVFDGSSLRFGDASGEQEMDVGQNPVVRTFVETFLDLLAGNRAKLERAFLVDFRTDDGVPSRQNWELSLVPRSPELLAILHQVHFRGAGVVVTEMRILEASGDEAVTTFSDVDPAHRYTAEEAAGVFRVPDGK
jgi:outer membrane lipoprotein-sorting protein